jgi:hypothetical protein
MGGAGDGVAGGACGYYCNVGLFGGPPSRRGCGQTVPPGDAGSSSPMVELPPGGSAAGVSAEDAGGALAQYGPATLFAGRPRRSGHAGRPSANSDEPVPPSGPLTVKTKGKVAVTSSATVRDVGAGPLTATTIRSTCHASRSGRSAQTRITKGVLVTGADADGNATTSEAIPPLPPPNYALTGVNGIGDSFRAVFNEQAVADDGTITVTAVHLYLLGPTAVGDVIIARSYARA